MKSSARQAVEAAIQRHKGGKPTYEDIRANCKNEGCGHSSASLAGIQYGGLKARTPSTHTIKGIDLRTVGIR